MYRIIFPEGQIECERYEKVANGVDIYDDGELIAFVPYDNLHAVIDIERSSESENEPSVM